MFVSMGKVAYVYSFSMAAIMVVGAIIGAKMAVTRGTKFIKPMFLIVTTVVLSKMIAESIFGIDVGAGIKNIMTMFMK